MMARKSAQQKLRSRLKELRKQAGLTQEELGFMIKLDRSYISGVERGVRNPSIKNVAKIAKALNVSISDLTNF